MFSRRRACAWLIAASLTAACDAMPFAAANEQGGAYVILEVDAEQLLEQHLQQVADEMASALRDARPAIRYTGRGVINGAARIRLIDQTDRARALAALRPLATAAETNEEMLTFSTGADGAIEARLPPSRATAVAQQAVAQSMEVIRRRLEQLRVRGAEIEQQGDTRIFVRAPRITDPTVLRRSVGVTGQLTFHMVREVAPEDVAAGNLPPGTMVVGPYQNSGATNEIVERRARFTGERLVRVTPSADPYTGEWVLSFGLDAEGTRIFCRVTRENTGKRFAVLLDNQVLTAPLINEPICGGTGQISGNFTAQSVNDLSVMLRAGALPAPLIVVEEGFIPPAP